MGLVCILRIKPIHALKKTYGKRLRKPNVDVFLLKRLMRHRDNATTDDFYSSIDLEEQREALARSRRVR
jgi:hypothetical protein